MTSTVTVEVLVVQMAVQSDSARGAAAGTPPARGLGVPGRPRLRVGFTPSQAATGTALAVPGPVGPGVVLA